MKGKITTIVAGAALLWGGGAAAPPLPQGPIASPLTTLSAAAAVTKSFGGGGGGGNVSGAGSRLGALLSGWGVPVLIALAGVLLVGALASRNIGASVGIVVITLIGLIFLLAPSVIEGAARQIANVVF